ncbi:MAG TPA: hypothetical protein VFO05_11415 [Candidatus Limnocylindrales bacterium]|nr:hypothetical protein [Candidatus Limnocylindrales bacterium]
MNNSLRVAVGAVAVVAVALLAATLVPKGPAPGVGNEGPSPTTSPQATARPSPSSSPAVLLSGPLEPGTYATSPVFPLAVTVTVPDGWGVLTMGTTVIVLESSEAYLGLWIAESTDRDPCALGGVDDSPVGPTAGDLAAALAGAPGFETTGPIDASVGGVDGTYIELVGPVAGCTEPTLWLTPDGSCRCMESTVERNRLWIVDVDGTRLVVDALEIPASDGVTGTSAAVIEEIQGMVDSLQISP